MSIEAIAVSHAYGNRPPVLDRVSLRVAPGESVAIVGPSGSGKTTLLTIVGLLVTPTKGEIRIDGHPVRGAFASAEARQRIFSWVFQTANVLKGRTPLDNAALGLLARGWDHVAARDVAAKTLRMVGLDADIKRPTSSLSGGELQRVAIARAVAATPRCILADEPTGQLDRSTSNVVVDALLAPTATGIAVVFSTHDSILADRCDRRVRLENGRCVEA